MGDELRKDYDEYLERFTSEIGDAELGSFVKYNGLLIQKLRYEEFGALFKDYNEVSRSYFESLKRGDTINDLVVRKLRELATKLVMSSPM